MAKERQCGKGPLGGRHPCQEGCSVLPHHTVAWVGDSAWAWPSSPIPAPTTPKLQGPPWQDTSQRAPTFCRAPQPTGSRNFPARQLVGIQTAAAALHSASLPPLLSQGQIASPLPTSDSVLPSLEALSRYKCLTGTHSPCLAWQRSGHPTSTLGRKASPPVPPPCVVSYRRGKGWDNVCGNRASSVASW